jgi:hypothetical protein
MGLGVTPGDETEQLLRPRLHPHQSSQNLKQDQHNMIQTPDSKTMPADTKTAPKTKTNQITGQYSLYFASSFSIFNVKKNSKSLCFLLDCLKSTLED